MNRKWIALLLSCVLVLTLAAACGRKDNAGNNNANNTNQGANSGNPEGTTPGNDMNGGGNSTNSGTGMNDGGNGMTGNNGMNGGNSMNGDNRGEYPTFPNSLATADADVPVDDLIATLGLTATDLETAMRDVSTVGDNVEGARTYRHKLLGHEADVSYGFDDQDMIDRITVRTEKDRAEDWRREFNDTLGATAVEGQTDTWNYSESQVKITEDGDHLLITIEKPKG